MFDEGKVKEKPFWLYWAVPGRRSKNSLTHTNKGRTDNRRPFSSERQRHNCSHLLLTFHTLQTGRMVRRIVCVLSCWNGVNRNYESHLRLEEKELGMCKYHSSLSLSGVCCLSRSTHPLATLDPAAFTQGADLESEPIQDCIWRILVQSRQQHVWKESARAPHSGYMQNCSPNCFYQPFNGSHPQ